MKISKDQERILAGFSCQRLSEDENNFRLIENFSNSINDSIAETLRNEAYREDETKSVAYYVIKHPNDQILFFFSLKCGMLFDHLIDPGLLSHLQRLTEDLEDKANEKSLSPLLKKEIADIMEKIRTSKGVAADDLRKLRQLKLDTLDELTKELNNDIARVGRTFSGIELVHFCSNTETDDTWENLEFPQLRGTTLFWYFVVPKVMEALNYVGCQYMFLFAADKSKDEKLIRYYEDQLNFRRPDGLATAKPIYDFTCKFMYHDISSLEKERNEFFDNFNPDADMT